MHDKEFGKRKATVDRNNDMTNNNPTHKQQTRRSKWQMIASRKLPYSVHMDGDGPHVVLSRCTGRTFRHWRYWLYPTGIAATVQRAALDKAGCHSDCKGKHEHAQWELMPWDAPPRRRPVAHRPPAPVAPAQQAPGYVVNKVTATMALPLDVDPADVDWL